MGWGSIWWRFLIYQWPMGHISTSRCSFFVANDKLFYNILVLYDNAQNFTMYVY